MSRRIPTHGSTLAALLVGVAGLLACGDGAGPSDAIAECLAEAGVTGPAVAIRDFAFTPATLRVEPGTTVTWVNCEPAGTDAHTTTSDDDAWDSGFLSRGDVFTRQFDEPGTYPYHCVPHPFMQGVIEVEA